MMSSGLLVPVGVLDAVFLALHVVIRLRAPFADPVLMPAVALLNGLGSDVPARLDMGRGQRPPTVPR